MTASDSLKNQIQADMKSAMRGGDKEKLATIRLMLAAIKQVEVDTRKELTDADVIAVLDKMGKQRRESIDQFEKADRQDLADKEKSELELIGRYLPTPMTESEISVAIEKAVQATSASCMQDMGAVMALLKPQLQGRADMAAVSRLVKAKLS